MPYFTNLAMDKIFEFAKIKCHFSKFLPETKARLVLEVSNGFAILVRTSLNWKIVNNLCVKDFAEFISDAYKERENIYSQKDFKVVALPEFVILFKSSATIYRNTFIGETLSLFR